MIGSKMTGHPSDQVLLILFREFDDHAAAVYRFPQLFKPFVRLPRCGDIGKNHRAVVWDIPQNLRNFFPVSLIQLEYIHIIDLDKGCFRHHRQIFHRIGKGPEFKGFAV